MTIPSSGRVGILFLDVEGGWGGSSRSLYYLIEALDRTRFEPVVAMRKSGPGAKRYAELGVHTMYAPELSAFRPSERKNAVSFALFIWGLRGFPGLLKRLRPLVARHGIALIHVNHESLAVFGYLLAKALGIKWVCHNRTLVIPGWFARRLHRLVATDAAHAIFISEPVLEHVKISAADAFDPSKASVVYNIAPQIAAELPPLVELEKPEDRFRVLSLTNFSPNRGVDRIVDVAEILQRRGDNRFAFYLCGKPANTNAITGRTDPYFDSVRRRVQDAGLRDSVFFPGHVGDPERALAACDVLIKLTRQSNPWGRDAMEALAAGLPVVTLGTFQGFIENETNGYIAQDYHPEEIADYLQRLAGDPALRQRIAAANKVKAEQLFGPGECARAMETVYRRVLDMDAGIDGTAKSCAA